MKFMSAKEAADSCHVSKTVKPFLKWAGGKGQLLKEIQKYYPFETQKITKYAEPFIGGGAVLFDILSHYELDEIYISDINEELINAYFVIRDHVNEIILLLKKYQYEYIELDNSMRKEYYQKKRETFNTLKMNIDGQNKIEKAALLIFLNKTCFNGLYRVNKKGLFNVPMGSYKNPKICDEENLRVVSEKLQKVQIVCGDYRISESFIDKNTFVYFDPPYRPITDTSNFTSYHEFNFNDEEQVKLAHFIEFIHKKGAKIVLSNSDPKNIDADDNFFDQLYKSFHIERVEASRMINSKSQSRGKIKEILISNF